MNQYNDLIKKNNVNVKKYTLKGKTLIIDTEKGKYALKKDNNVRLFNYLESKKFYNYPKIIDYTRESSMYEYINDISYAEEERALDLIRVLSILHLKTSYNKEITDFEYKKIYEELSKEIDYKYNYYLDLINIIENKIYMSPSEYLLARNISIVFFQIYYAKNTLEKFMNDNKDIKTKRVSTLHNNVDTSNLLRNEEIYLISWKNKENDSPIYDLIDFYNKRVLDFDFNFLLNEYEKINPLTKSEKELLYIFISIPDKIVFTNNEYINIKNVRKFLDKVYKSDYLLKSKKETETTNAEEAKH